MVALVGKWFGKSKRGLIFGIWNSHASVGQALGSVVASAFVEKQWALSFIVPGVIIIACGIFALLFVIVRPEDVGFPPANFCEGPPEPGPEGCGESASTVASAKKILRPDEPTLHFLAALRTPGVVEFAMCVFFNKAVSYVFFLWLPVYIKDENPILGSAAAGYLSMIFDIGAILGGIITGALSDWVGARGGVSFAFALMAGVFLVLFVNFGPANFGSLVTLLLCLGITVVGPYTLITTAVSADLGASLKGKPLATVTGIINGMGSFGSAHGPLMVGHLRNSHDWRTVFHVLTAMEVVSALCLTRIVYAEMRDWRGRRRAAKALEEK